MTIFIFYGNWLILVSLCGNQLAGILFLSTSLLILMTGVGEPHPFFWRSFSSSGAPRHSCEKSAGCFVFCETVCDIFFVNLGKLTSVWKERHLARFLVLSGEVFVFRSCLFQKTIVKINFNEYEKLIESGHSSFMKKITPKFSKCRRCGNVLKSHSKRYCGLRCSGIKPRWKEH